ncbi:MAG: hypothetical protein WA637_09765 [Terriglobales bacterium]
MATMLLGCVLGLGFMVRFLIALTVDGKEAHSVHPVRPGGLHYVADRSRSRAAYNSAVANSASHLAIGVVRITRALAANRIRGNRRPAVHRLHLVTFGKTHREVDITAERRYRSG